MGQSKKEREALRYRLIVRLSLIRREAEAQGRDDVRIRTAALKEALEKLELPPDPDAPDILAPFVREVDEAQRLLGLPEHGMRAYPRWLPLLIGALPLVLVLAVIALVIERRRQKRQIDAAALAKLEAQATSSSAPSSPARPRR